MEIRYASNIKDVKDFNTERIRDEYLIQNIFISNQVKLIYSHYDRIIIGGVFPIDKIIELDEAQEIQANYFLERRELGIINIGGPGVIILDDIEYELNNKDALYVGMGTKKVLFKSKDINNPAKFYLNSAPAHHKYPNTKITLQKANKIKLGDQNSSNKRTINQYIHPDICNSCQLVMGMTILESGSVWNSMPTHTHDRRMEVYFYFDTSEETRIFHFMGNPQETKHIILKNEEAVISPPWSIHCGVGTTNYSFIWGMAGENQIFSDATPVTMNELK